MDNSSPDLQELIRELAAQRDAGLQNGGPEISFERLGRLRAALAQRFPVETGLDSAAMRRDASLSPRELQIPLVVENGLTKRLAFSGEYETNEPRRYPRQTVRIFGQRLATAATLAAAVIILLGGAFYFSRSPGDVTSRRVSGAPGVPFPHTSINGSSDAASFTYPGDRLFDSSGDHLTLRVGKIELASLQPSLLMIAGTSLADWRHSDQGLPLDLPIREMLIDAAGPATP